MKEIVIEPCDPGHSLLVPRAPGFTGIGHGIAAQTIQGHTDANLGDRERYAGMRGHEVDPSKIAVPCLTLDGWILPKAED